MNIAILGGSFDPPHRGHQATAKRLLKLIDVDQIWLMPCFKHPFNKSLSSSNHRLAMTKYLEKSNIKVSDFELSKKSTSYTIDTLNALTIQYPNETFSWIIGSEQVKSFTKWKNWKEITDKFKLIIVPRTNYKEAKRELKDIIKLISFPKNIILIDRNKFRPIYVSSTLIRKRINPPAGGKKSVSNMIPKKVEEYIIKHRLYR